MKVKIVQADGKIKTCPNCKGQIFRHSYKSRITKREPLTKSGFKEYGEHYELIICNSCGQREKRNVIQFHTINRGG